MKKVVARKASVKQADPGSITPKRSQKRLSREEKQPIAVTVLDDQLRSIRMGLCEDFAEQLERLLVEPPKTHFVVLMEGAGMPSAIAYCARTKSGADAWANLWNKSNLSRPAVVVPSLEVLRMERRRTGRRRPGRKAVTQ